MRKLTSLPAQQGGGEPSKSYESFNEDNGCQNRIALPITYLRHRPLNVQSRVENVLNLVMFKYPGVDLSSEWRKQVYASKRPIATGKHCCETEAQPKLNPRILGWERVQILPRRFDILAANTMALTEIELSSYCELYTYFKLYDRLCTNPICIAAAS